MKTQKTRKKARLRNDLILIFALLFIALVGCIYLFFFREGGDTVTVTVDGKPYGVYALGEDRTVEIRTGDEGEERNLLVIKDGRARMESASCPDGICVSHHAIFRDGESIVCLPHRVVVTVTARDGDAPDIVS